MLATGAGSLQLPLGGGMIPAATASTPRGRVATAYPTLQPYQGHTGPVGASTGVAVVRKAAPVAVYSGQGKLQIGHAGAAGSCGAGSLQLGPGGVAACPGWPGVCAAIPGAEATAPSALVPPLPQTSPSFGWTRSTLLAPPHSIYTARPPAVQTPREASITPPALVATTQQVQVTRANSLCGSRRVVHSDGASASEAAAAQIGSGASASAVAAASSTPTQSPPVPSTVEEDELLNAWPSLLVRRPDSYIPPQQSLLRSTRAVQSHAPTPVARMSTAPAMRHTGGCSASCGQAQCPAVSFVVSAANDDAHVTIPVPVVTAPGVVRRSSAGHARATPAGQSCTSPPEYRFRSTSPRHTAPSTPAQNSAGTRMSTGGIRAAAATATSSAMCAKPAPPAQNSLASVTPPRTPNRITPIRGSASPLAERPWPSVVARAAYCPLTPRNLTPPRATETIVAVSMPAGTGTEYAAVAPIPVSQAGPVRAPVVQLQPMTPDQSSSIATPRNAPLTPSSARQSLVPIGCIAASLPNAASGVAEAATPPVFSQGARETSSAFSAASAKTDQDRTAPALWAVPIRERASLDAPDTKAETLTSAFAPLHFNPPDAALAAAAAASGNAAPHEAGTGGSADRTPHTELIQELLNTIESWRQTDEKGEEIARLQRSEEEAMMAYKEIEEKFCQSELMCYELVQAQGRVIDARSKYEFDEAAACNALDRQHQEILALRSELALTSSPLFSRFPDASSADGLIWGLRNVGGNISDFKVAFCDSRISIRCQFQSYKADITVPKKEGVTDVFVPWSKFSNKWSASTGAKTADSPPTAASFKSITQLQLWTEGVLGDFHLELHYVRAGSPTATFVV